LWWKFAVRAALRGNSLLVVGPSGCGKTLLANALKVALNRVDKYFYVNLGATQDPRSTLIGNTHYDPTMGTYVSLSYFAHAIQVPNAIILLDEASRAHPEAHNILMTVLDKSQRYMRVDEKADTQTIKVAEGVCFVLTANVGAEYTATRTMDRALLDRCTMFEMRPLSEGDEFDNLTSMFPDVKASMLKAIAKIADVTRKEINSESPKVDTIISTRMTEEMASLIHDGFNLAGAAETCIYPYFNDAGGADSPRSFMKALVQKHLPTEFDGKATPFKDADPNKNKATPWG
jgi:MoxR-like ATPase